MNGIEIEERWLKPTPEYPQGSYLRVVDGKVEMAIGWYEQEYPGHPSPYWHRGPPFFVFESIEVPWGDNGKGEN